MQHWYVLQVKPGHEKKVRKSLDELIQKSALSERITDIFMPTEHVMEVKHGKQRVSEKRPFPGYIMVKMDMDEQIWGDVETIGAKFLRCDGKPAPMSDAEAAAMLEHGQKGVVSKDAFKMGDFVKVNDGPFNGFSGHVHEINPEKGKLLVNVLIFGRATPVELEFWQVEASTPEEANS